MASVLGCYHYTARTLDGAAVSGTIECADERAALASLRTRALFVTSIVAERSAMGTVRALCSKAPSKPAVLAFLRSFSTLVGAGVPVRRALEVNVEQCASDRLKESLVAIVHDIDNGLSLSDAMGRRPKEFNALHVAMIRAGETGGVLDETLLRLAATLEREHALRKRTASALAYPAFVAASALGLIVFLMTSIVPAFESMYAQMHVALPPITIALVRTGALLRAPSFQIAAVSALFAGGVLFHRLRANGSLDALLLRLPVVSGVLRKTALARLAQILGTLLKSGVTLLESIDVAAQAIGSGSYGASLTALRTALAEGSRISGPLEACGLYDPLFVQLVRAGEETGTLEEMLLQISRYYETEVEAALAALSSLLEPALILLLGGAVSFVVGAIFIPLYSLIGSIR